MSKEATWSYRSNNPLERVYSLSGGAFSQCIPRELQNIKNNKWNYLKKFIEDEIKVAQNDHDGVLERELKNILEFMNKVDNIKLNAD